MFTNFGKLFTSSVHQKEQKGGLVNIVHELWEIVHELCSPESAERGVGEQWSRTLASCSRTMFTITDMVIT